MCQTNTIPSELSALVREAQFHGFFKNLQKNEVKSQLTTHVIIFSRHE